MKGFFVIFFYEDFYSNYKQIGIFIKFYKIFLIYEVCSMNHWNIMN